MRHIPAVTVIVHVMHTQPILAYGTHRVTRRNDQVKRTLKFLSVCLPSIPVSRRINDKCTLFGTLKVTAGIVDLKKSVQYTLYIN